MMRTRQRIAEEPLLVTLADAAALLSLSMTALRELVDAGEIPSLKIGRTVRVPRAALQAWINAKIGAQP